jgi:FADH2 O2-dependent halogenase
MTTATNGQDQVYDVLILGTGIGGTVLGTILARHGVRVVMVEQGMHPRFAIGESTIPETSLMLRLMSKRYDVPELHHLSSFPEARAHVSNACGVKRNFSFCWQPLGAELDPAQIDQLLTWAPPFGPDIHYFRQDVDAHMLNAAVRYGARCHQLTKVTDVAISDDGVVAVTDKALTFKAKFVIDAGGIQSPLGRQFGLRETNPEMHTSSRGLYTHMVNVKAFDTVAPSGYERGLRSPTSQGTLHHIFEKAWMWVIPFNNHVTATNPVVSVGLCLNRERHPATGMPPEEEFFSFVKGYPTVARQFEHARPVRPWVAADRLQFFSTRMMGKRFFLMPHAACFVDPLFSSGLAITMQCVNNVAHRLITAVKTDDFAEEHFAHAEEWALRAFRYYDRLVGSGYTAMQSWELWNAWVRIWMMGSVYGVSAMTEILIRFEESKDPRVFDLFEQKPYRSVHAYDMDEYYSLFNSWMAEMDALRAGNKSQDAVIAALYQLLSDCPVVPGPWKLSDPLNRCPGSLTFVGAMRMFAWGKMGAPESIRRNYFRAMPGLGTLGGLRKAHRELVKKDKGGTRATVRDALRSWNEDFLHY